MCPSKNIVYEFMFTSPMVPSISCSLWMVCVMRGKWLYPSHYSAWLTWVTNALSWARSSVWPKCPLADLLTCNERYRQQMMLPLHSTVFSAFGQDLRICMSFHFPVFSLFGLLKWHELWAVKFCSSDQYLMIDLYLNIQRILCLSFRNCFIL